MFPSEKVNIIFGNIEEIYEFATKLYSDLEKVVNTEQPHLTEFGHCFLDKVRPVLHFIALYITKDILKINFLGSIFAVAIIFEDEYHST